MCRKENRPGTGEKIFSGLSPELLKVVSLGTKPLTQSPIGTFSYSNSDFGKVFCFLFVFSFLFFGGGGSCVFKSSMIQVKVRKSKTLTKDFPSIYVCRCS